MKYLQQNISPTTQKGIKSILRLTDLYKNLIIFRGD